MRRVVVPVQARNTRSLHRRRMQMWSDPLGAN